MPRFGRKSDSSKNRGDAQNCGGNMKTGLVSSVGRTGGMLNAVRSHGRNITMEAVGFSCCGKKGVVHNFVWSEPANTFLTDIEKDSNVTIKAMDEHGKLVGSYNETCKVVANRNPLNGAGNPGHGDQGVDVSGGFSLKTVTFNNGVATVGNVEFGNAGSYRLALVDCAGVNHSSTTVFKVERGRPAFLQSFYKSSGGNLYATNPSIPLYGRMQKNDPSYNKGGAGFNEGSGNNVKKWTPNEEFVSEIDSGLANFGETYEFVVKSYDRWGATNMPVVSEEISVGASGIDANIKVKLTDNNDSSESNFNSGNLSNNVKFIDGSASFSLSCSQKNPASDPLTFTFSINPSDSNLEDISSTLVLDFSGADLS